MLYKSLCPYFNQFFGASLLMDDVILVLFDNKKNFKSKIHFYVSSIVRFIELCFFICCHILVIFTSSEMIKN